MSGTDIDRQSAAAESRLDAMDDAPGRAAGPDSIELGEGMHIETAPTELVGGDSDDDGHVLVDHAALVDEVSEAFNARDLDALADLCASDCETPGLANDLQDLEGSMADLWERRPTITMTRAEDEGAALGVLWERGETATWAPIGTCHVDVDEDGLAAVLEFSDDVGLLDQLDLLDPPDGELEEGARWEEWEDGAD